MMKYRLLSILLSLATLFWSVSILCACEIEKLSEILRLYMDEREAIFFAKDAEYHSA